MWERVFGSGRSFKRMSDRLPGSKITISGRRKLVIWGVGVAVLLAIVVAILASRPRTRPLSLAGAVMRQDADPKKELPLADVAVAAVSNGSVIGDGKSDASG